MTETNSLTTGAQLLFYSIREVNSSSALKHSPVRNMLRLNVRKAKAVSFMLRLCL